jgi:acetyl esterase/lipase
MIEHRVGTSRRAGTVHTVSRMMVRPAMRYYPLCGPTLKVFPLLEKGAQRMPRSSGITHRPITARTWRGELLTPIDGPTSDGAVLYFHGGAFLSCGLGTHRRIVERLARRTGMTVLTVDYRQLPTGRLRDSISDCEDAFSWLVRQGHAPSEIVVVGDSAGGHLAFATTLRVRDEGIGTPAGVVGLSPWLDFDHMAKLRHHNARRDAYIPARRFRRIGRMVVGDHPELHHSPVNADLHGMPPSLIICAEDEVLRVDAELMSERLTDAGVPCTLQIWEGQVHAFPVLSDLVPEAKAAIDEVVTFIEQSVAAPAYARGREGVLPDAVTSIDVA